MPPPTAEQHVYTTLAKALSVDDHTLHANVDWAALSHEAPGRAQGEADILVCSPKHGVLVLEVKGGGIGFDLATKAWWSVDRTGTRRGIQDPMKQAAITARHLIELAKQDPVLSHGGGFPLPIGHAVVTPHTNWRPSDLPLHWPRELVLDADALRSPAQAIASAFEYWAGRFPPRRPLEVPQWRHLNARLSPRATRAMCLSAVIADEEQRFVELTNQQIAAMQMLRLFPRLKVMGCAGSGKTLLAVAEARRLGADGRRVLLMVFNRLLAEFLGKVLQGAPNITVRNFHTLCHEICAAAGVPKPTPEPGADERQFWTERFPEIAFQHIDKFETRYDAILVDEGQDFRADWWALVELLGTPNARLVVFYDPNQDIFNAGAAIPIVTPPAVLTQNCRSTAALNRAACAIGKVEFPGESSGVEGEAPEVAAYSRDDEVPRAVLARLRKLVKDQKLPAGAITILSPRRFPNSCLSDSENLGEFHLAWEGEPTGPHDVRYATLQSFKGLESDVVLLVDVDLDHKTCVPANLYVAFSRAKHRMTVWIQKGQADRLRNLLKATTSVP